MDTETSLVVDNLFHEYATRSDGEAGVSRQLAAMSSTERQRVHHHLLEQAAMLDGYTRLSGAQRQQLDGYRALLTEVRGAEREHIRALVADGGPTEQGTPFGRGPRPTEPTAVAAARHIDGRDGYQGAERLQLHPLGGMSRVQLRDTAMRTVEDAMRSQDLPRYAADRVDSLLRNGTPSSRDMAARWAVATGEAAYRSCFAKLLADPVRGHLLWTAEESEAYRRVAEVQSEMRGMSLTDNAGGYMVPFTLDPSIMLTSDGSINPLRRIARTVQTSTSDWNGVTSAGVTAEWVAEGAEVADASPTLAQPNIPVFKGDAFIEYTFEVGQDAVGFLSELQGLLNDAADQLQATAFTTGTGVGQPTGIVTALAGTSSEINSGGTEALLADDPYTLQNALPPRFSARAQWSANLSIINTLRQFETTNGALKFPELASNPPMLLGRAMSENSDMDGAINAAATENNYALLYGDFQQFVIVDRIGTTLELIPNMIGANRRPTGSRGALLWYRTGSDVVVPEAFRLLDIPTTA